MLSEYPVRDQHLLRTQSATNDPLASIQTLQPNTDAYKDLWTDPCCL